MAKKILSTLVWLLVAAGLGYGGYYYYKKSSRSNRPKPKVRTAVIKRGDFKLIVSATGAVEPKDIVEIRPKATGEVHAIHFEEGQRVQKGQLLIELDPTLEQRRLNQSRADLAIARANVIKAHKVYEHRLAKYQTEKRLLKKRLVTRESVDNLKHEVAVRKAEKTVVKAQLRKARELVREAEDRLKDTRIMAPFSGVILHRYVKKGQIIFSGLNSLSGGTLLCQMANLTTLYVRVAVDEADVANIRPSIGATITVDALPGRKFAGTVLRINPQGKTVNNVTTFEVFVKLAPEAANVLKVQMTANVKILVHRINNILLVPSVAVRRKGGKTGIYKMKNGQPTFVPIKVGRTNGTETVVQTGANEGETIVLTRVGPRKGGWMRSKIQKRRR